ncbi:hypothetical protein [Ovoidimarina sediminis]|uniref:hypothetical protein n=1 Tax=Ovoidimarina sediminis TaxID=3079856 RepID=UPI002913E4D0|nr:hypothetical protein [Rhodophyticola sp. MJ-SS7]MDU8944806.1 hypothetical protein [Rhodophyticola sp. MJ-SS7]
MTASTDGKWRYFVSKDNHAAKVWRTPISVGRGVWLGNGFHTPAWPRGAAKIWRS